MRDRSFDGMGDMKISWFSITLPMILIVAILVAECTTPSLSPQSSNQSFEPRVLNIGSVLENPAPYNGTSVAFQGKIVAECGSGCWFILDDGTGRIYVQLKDNNFVIPQSQGESARVVGIVLLSSGDVTVIGKKVEINGKTYQ